MNVQPSMPLPENFRSPKILFFLLGLNALVQIVLRISISDSLDLDEAEQVFFSQWLVLGYGPQPPLYNWIQQGLFALIPHQILALSLMKHLLFIAIFLLMYKTTRLLAKERAAAILAVAMLFLMPELSFEGQRDLTHTVLAAACSLWFFHVLTTILLKSNAVNDFLRFGLALGCCLLAKYNTLLMIVPILAVVTGIDVFRRRLFVGRAWLSVLAAISLCAPHWYWLCTHLNDATANSIHKMALAKTNSGVATRTAGLVDVTGAILGISALLLVVVVVAFWRCPRKTPGPSGLEKELAKLFKRYLGVIPCLLLAFVAFGVGNFKARWLLPSFIFLPSIICFYLFNYRQPSLRRIQAVFIIAAAIGITIPIVLGARVVWATPGHYKRLNEPYRELVQQFPATSDLLLITDQNRVAGNLKHHLPGNVQVVSSDKPYFPLPAPTYKTAAIAWRESKHPPTQTNPVPARLIDFAEAQTGRQITGFDGMATLYAPYKYGSEKQSLNLAWFSVE